MTLLVPPKGIKALLSTLMNKRGVFTHSPWPWGISTPPNSHYHVEIPRVALSFMCTVGIQKPDMSWFWMVDHVWFLNGVRISNGQPFLNKMAAILSIPFEIRPPKWPVFKWFWILNGRILDSHCTIKTGWAARTTLIFLPIK